mmetsp:Transcript_49945/g.109106  ORF Transcript_49945/g.109106 Transcript_49945/m.109106 type:complete len:278 (+) Transcript_49945:113-946(+)
MRLVLACVAAVAARLSLGVAPCSDCYKAVRATPFDELRPMPAEKLEAKIAKLQEEVEAARQANDQQQKALSGRMEKLEAREKRNEDFVNGMEDSNKADKTKQATSLEEARKQVADEQVAVEDVVGLQKEQRFLMQQYRDKTLARLSRMASCGCKSSLLELKEPEYNLIKQVEELEAERNELLEASSKAQLDYNVKQRSIMKHMEDLERKKNNYKVQQTKEQTYHEKIYPAARDQYRSLQKIKAEKEASLKSMEEQVSEMKDHLNVLEHEMQKCGCQG